MFEVIGVGLPRTGTQSLADALDVLGYKCCHRAVLLFSEQLDWNARSSEAMSASLFCDSWHEWTAIIESRWWSYILEANPKAKVVLTVRDPQRWYDSIKEHTRVTRFTMTHEELTKDKALHTHLFGYWEPERNIYIDRFRQHTWAVQAFCSSRRLCLLTIDLTRPVQWRSLCKFLGCEVPAQEFPWRNELVTP